MQKYNMCDTQNVPKSLVHEYLQATGAVSRAAADVDSVLSSVIITRWDQLELGVCLASGEGVPKQTADRGYRM